MATPSIDMNSIYKELKVELQIGKIGGLFLVLYQDDKIIEIIINKLKRNLPDYFIFKIHMNVQKVGFPTFFEQTFTQTGEKSNIFHVTGIDALPEELRSNFIDYLQYTRERFKAKPYSIVFWITPQFEKQLFFSAPDFHHWISGTYDFSRIDLDNVLLEETKTNQEIPAIPLENIKINLEKVVWQYEHWREAKDNEEEFLIEVMGRANLNDYYVPSYCLDKNGEEFLLDDLFAAFLADNSKNFLTLLGDFGTGKTSFALHYYIYLAKQFLNDETRRIPIFISLKEYKEKLNIEMFMVKEFYEKYGITISFAIFQELAMHGKFIFFVDGFDEMASLADKEMTIQNLKELTKLSFENILFMTNKQSTHQKANKVFLTCRTHYFLTEIQEKEILKADYTVLYRNYATRSNYEMTRIKLKEFNEKQIEEYIWKNTRDKEKVNEYMRIIKDTYNLEELSTRPLLLDMIIKTLPSLKDKKRINAANLYKAYTDIWIEREDWRSQMTAEGKRNFMWELALKMFEEGGDFTLHYSKLNKPQGPHFKKGFEMFADDYYKYETTTCSFLNRDTQGNYKFIHKSFMEYFLAEYFFHRIENREKRIIAPNKLNKETEFFLKFIISSSQKTDWQNLDLCYLNIEDADLSIGNLYGTNFQGAKLIGADLHCANLESANFNNADLTGANLIRANLNRGNLRNAILQNAHLKEADLKNADLKGADLKKADLKEVSLHVANLYWCNLKETDLQGADLQGAYLFGADFLNANLCRVNLSGAKNISPGMLVKVKTLYQIKGLDAEIEAKVRKLKPELFDDPEE